MRYRLTYFQMCARDNYPSKEPRTREFDEEGDDRAVKTANEFLKKEHMGTLVRPWAPQLFNGKRMVATSEPEYPPRAHHLAWIYPIGATHQLVS